MTLTEAPRSADSTFREGNIFTRFPELKEVREKNRFPSNIFIIPDGNGRWAALHKTAIAMGHQKGAEVIVEAFKDLNELRDYIPFVGAWGFSVDNLNRPKQEVDFLMNLFESTIKRLQPELVKRENKFVHIGRKDIFKDYPSLEETITSAEESTRNNDGQVIYIGIGFGGEDQELRISEKVAEQARQNSNLKITREFVSSLRDGQGLIPPADLIIRSSGEHRLSDVGWIHGKGTELYFDTKFFPSFTTRDFVKAIVAFSKRERKFGGRPVASK